MIKNYGIKSNTMNEMLLVLKIKYPCLGLEQKLIFTRLKLNLDQ